MSWSIILIKTPLNDESDLSDVDETLPITIEMRSWIGCRTLLLFLMIICRIAK